MSPTIVVFSSGGVVALALAERHPDVVDHVIAWEPALIAALPYAEDVYAAANGPYLAYLDDHPGDWIGGYHVLLDVLSEGRADHNAPLVFQSERNAEAMLRDDGPRLVRYQPDGDIAERLGEALGRPPVVLTGTWEHKDYLLRPTVAAARLAGLIGARMAPVS